MTKIGGQERAWNS